MTNIEWTDITWNPVTGCTKVSAGCKHCYAETVANRRLPHGGFADREFTDVRIHNDRLDRPLHWRKPRRVFVNSMSDLFHEDVPDAFIDQVFAVMALCPQHTFQVLSKRPERMLAYLSNPHRHDDIAASWNWTQLTAKMGNNSQAGRWPFTNVWLGVSCEDQATADERIPPLLRTPAVVRFLSCEPLLSRIDLCETFGMWWNQTMQCFEGLGQQFNRKGREGAFRPGINWVIVGGESGPGARLCDVEWIRSIVSQCKAAGVACFVKQGGRHNRCVHDQKGGCWMCMPIEIKVREYPNAT